jgi:pimeloyl-ACP methyl ester carboxylesterase
MMSSISFREYGEGLPVILIHGFPMDQNIWNDFVPALSSKFKVYTIDLPGFGESQAPSSFSMQAVAGLVLDWIAKTKISSPVVIGHSLGGYVTLAMVQQAPERFSGFGLFHSTALADTTEKKQSRDKVVEFVEKNGAPAFTSNFIPPLFANKDHVAIQLVKDISKVATSEAVIGYTLGMRDRMDTTSVFTSYDKPVLFILGKEDPGIPVESVAKQIELCKHPDVHILDGVGHMGMFEASQTTADIVSVFSEKALGM